MIAHFDLDAFYAAVAQLDDPSLRGRPIAVSGDHRRSVVLTASYEARPFGVRSAMPLYKARQACSELVVVPPTFTRYRELSRACFAIFESGSIAVEGLSLDEAFVEFDAEEFKEAVEYARRMRERIRTEIGLTASAGVAMQKMVAKIACDDGKPDGLKWVPPGTEAAYLAPLPVGRLWGVGPKTQQRLAAERIETIGQLAELSDERILRLFGRWGRELRELARGHDDRKVESDRETRSVSSETTFEYDVADPGDLRRTLHELSADVAQRLAAQQLRGTMIGIKIKREDFTTVGRQTTVAEPTADLETIVAAALLCLDRADLEGRAVRLLGVRVASLVEYPTSQLSIFG
ncbi:MAG: DNA polymerase IV [Candidatus Eremiobacteraeota bacterium]|nr:DNA polymerase IV [Candidatus Eremiobacteraeota bacterium]